VVSVLEPHTDPRLSSAATDEAAGVALAVEHLRGLGHRRIAHVDGGAAAGSGARKLAYEQLMADDAAQPLVIAGGPSETDGMRAARALLDLRALRSPAELPTAVVVFNDDAALGFLHALDAAGADVPAELSVVGYDDSRLAALAHVQLTSVRQDPDALAGAAVAGAAAALEGRRTHTLVPPSLTVRSSTAPLSAVAR
jgi:DNA-binding LacI/PurR family transcriptional regulator